MTVGRPGGSRDIADYGAFVISLDFEIHWGVRDTKPVTGAYRDHLLGVRAAVPRMLELFREFDIAATWATVGMLFLRDREDWLASSPALRPTYEQGEYDPYKEEIGSGEEDDPFHFAPSLIDRIREYPRQEIASHTYSHYFCLEPGQTEAQFAADLAAAAAVAERQGIPLRSIVFPRNQINEDYLKVVKEAGFTSYRGNQKGWSTNAANSRAYRSKSKRLLRLLDQYVRITGGQLVEWESLDGPHGLIDVAASNFLRPYHPRLAVLDPLRARRIRGDMREAAEKKKIYHLWWHPHNFGKYPDENLAFLRTLLTEFRKLRSDYGMRSLTMAEVAQEALCHSHEAPAP